DLRFSIVKRNGRNYVQVSSAKQIAVPYLNFILQLTSPEGVVSREYAIFLDPASVGKKKRSNKRFRLASPYRSTAKTKLATTPPSRTKKAPAAAMQQMPRIDGSRLKGGRYGPVARGETLWSIASRTRPSESIPVKDMVAAIRRANPRALTRQLPAGSMLNIPTITGYSAYDGKKTVAPTPVKPKKRIKKTAKRPKKATEKPVSTALAQQPTNLPKPSPSATNKATATPAALPTVSTPKPDSPAITDTGLSEIEKTITGTSNATDSGIEKTGNTATPLLADNATNAALNADDAVASLTSSGEGNNTDNAAATAPASDNPAKAALEEAAAETSSTASTAATEAPATTGKVKIEEKKPEVTNTVKAETTAAKTTETVTQTSPATNTEKTSPAVTVSESSTKTTVAKTTEGMPKKADGAMQLLQDNGPIVGGIVAVLGLGGLLLFNRRRKAKLAAIPGLTGDNAIVLTDEESIEKLFQETSSEQTAGLLPSVDEPDTDETLPDTDLHTAIEDTPIAPTDTATEDTPIAPTDTDKAIVAADVEAADDDDLDLDDLDLGTDENIDLSEELDIDLDDDLLIDDQLSFDDNASESAVALSAAEPSSSTVTVTTEATDDDLLFDLSDGDEISVDLPEVADSGDVDNVALEFDIDDHNLLSDEPPLLADDNSSELLTDDNSDIDLDTLFEEDEFLSNINSEAAAVSERNELDDEVLDDEDSLSLDFDQEEVIKTFEAENAQPVATSIYNPNDKADSIEWQNSDAEDDKVFTNRESFEALHDGGNQLSAEDWLSDADENKDILIDFDERDNQDLPTMGKNEALQTDAQNVVVADADNAENNVQKTGLADEATNTRIQMKLDLANAFISISENHRAIDLLEEIVQTGSPEQVETAKGLLQQLNS
ncbi:MAG: hypothetical protein CR977_01145, partial [Gammaproteobacteria bacterium]